MIVFVSRDYAFYVTVTGTPPKNGLWVFSPSPNPNPRLKNSGFGLWVCTQTQIPKKKTNSKPKPKPKNIWVLKKSEKIYSLKYLNINKYIN